MKGKIQNIFLGFVCNIRNILVFGLSCCSFNQKGSVWNSREQQGFKQRILYNSVCQYCQFKFIYTNYEVIYWYVGLWLWNSKIIPFINIFFYFKKKPYILYEDSGIECNTGDHILYLVFAGIGMLLYYPLSSFLFPNIQFQNNDLDLKYNPTWIVILTQVKLLVSGTINMFK